MSYYVYHIGLFILVEKSYELVELEIVESANFETVVLLGIQVGACVVGDVDGVDGVDEQHKEGKTGIILDELKVTGNGSSAFL